MQERSAMFAVLIALLEIWLILTILAQSPRFKWIRWFQDRDYLALIPNWSFFAPNPGMGDFHLFYRDKLFDGQLTLWQDVAFSNGSLLQSIWNPDKRRRKAITNACLLLIQMASGKPKGEMLFVSMPYLLILRYIKTLLPNNSSHARQFLIAQTYGYYNSSQEPKILFISQFHKFERVPCQISLS
jgi:hypothetical protein